MFATEQESRHVRHDGISDWMLKEVRSRFDNRRSITKETIFYYIYGLLHSPAYRATFGPDLKKSLPRIPIVDDYEAFMDFCHAGRALAELHLNYEQAEPAQEVTTTDCYMGSDEAEHYRVEKMRFPQKGDRSSIIYNDFIRVDNIPEAAYDYVVNGKSAIEWLLERYAVTVNKDSLIKNDPNEWGRERQRPSYIFDLLLSVINVSVLTVDLVHRLPQLKFEGSKVTVIQPGHGLRPMEGEGSHACTGSDTLHLSIKQAFFNEIVAGHKTTECREIFNTYTAKKYLATDRNGTPLCDPACTVEGRIYHPDEYNNGRFPFLPKPFKHLCLSVGPFGDQCTVEVTGITFGVARQKAAGLVAWQVEYHLGTVSQVKRR